MKIFIALFVFPFWGSLFDLFFNAEPPCRTDFSEYVEPGSTQDWFDLRKEVNLSAAEFAALLMPSLGCPADELRLEKTTTDPPEAGWKHLRYQQFHKGMPVENAIWLLHENSRGRLAHGNGKGVAGLNLPTTSPALDEQAALEKALAFLPADRYAWQDTALEASLRLTSGDPAASYFPRGKLTVASPNFDRNPNEYRLAWRFDTYAVLPTIDRRHVFVDAATGEVFASVSRIAMHTDVPAQGISNYAGTVNFTACQSVNGIHHLHNNAGQHITLTGVGSSNLQGDVVSNDAFFGNDPAAVDVHWVVQRSLYLLQDQLNYDLLPDSVTLAALVHFQQPQLSPNAWYDGNFRLVFQDGNGVNWGAFTSPDIVAHELFHAVTAQTAGLLYQSEPGALNEFYSDFFAIWFESVFTSGSANYVMGDLADANPGNGLGVRNHQNPAAHSMPDSFLVDQFWKPLDGCQPSPIGNDWCYIHKHATVGGHAFYLLVEGGKGVSPLGMDVSADVFFHALNYLTPTSTYPDLRLAVLKSALELHENDPNVAAQVAKAFCAVLIGDCEPDALLAALTVQQPNGGETLTAGEIYSIGWTPTPGIDSVKIEHSLNGGATWLPVAAAVPNTGSFAWTVPSVSTTLAKVQVRALNNLLQFDASDSLFTIQDCQPIVGFYLDDATPCEGNDLSVQNAFPDTGFSWQWIFDDSVVSTDPQVVNLSSLAAGAHVLTLRAIAQGGVCTGEFSQTMTVTPAPAADFFLSAHDLTLTGSAVSAAGAFKWEWRVDGDLVGGNSPTLNYTLADTGEVEVCLTATGNCGVRQECRTMTVTENPPCQGNGEQWINYVFADRINDMAEDGDFIWLALPSGAAKFNRLTGETEFFTTTNSPLPHSNVESVFVDKNGMVWFAANDHLLGFQNGTWEVYNNENVPLLPKGIVQVRGDALGNLWCFGNNGIFRRAVDGSMKHFNLPNGLSYQGLRAIFPHNGEAWLTYSGSVVGLIKIDASEAFTTFSVSDGLLDNNSQEVLVDNEGKVWVSSNSGISIFDGINGWQSITATSHPQLESNKIADISLGRNGVVWVSSYYALNGFVGNEIEITTQWNGAVNNQVIEDENGFLWTRYRGDYAVGLYKSDTIGVVANYKASNSELISIPEDIEIGGDGKVYFAQGKQIFTLSNSNWNKLDFTGQADIIEKMSVDENFVWMDAGYAARLNLPNGPLLTYPSTDGCFFTNGIKDIEAFEGNGYCCSCLGLFKLEGSNAIPITLPTSYPQDLDFDNFGNLWFSTYSDTLFKREPSGTLSYFLVGTTWTFNIRKIAVAPDGKVWLASHSNGMDGSKSFLYCYDGVAFTNFDWLTSQYNHGFMEDMKIASDGTLWLATRNGLVRFNPAEPDSLKIFTPLNSKILGTHITHVALSPNGDVWATVENLGVTMIKSSSDAIQAAFASPSQICAQLPTTFTSQTPAAATQSWEINGVPTGTGATFTHTFPTPGDYTVTLRTGNGAGCEDAISHLVHVSPSAAAAQPPQTVLACNGEPVTLTVGASSDWLSVVWKDAFGNETGSEPTLEVTGSGIWYATVQDHCGGQATFPFSVYLDADCVFPGDVNLDNIVNQYDLIALAYAFGFTGLARPNASALWFGQPAPAWQGVLPTHPNVNLKHADCNGDGVVDENDIEVIVANWGLTHGAPNLTSPPVGGAHLTAKIVKLPTLDDSLMQVEIYLVNGQNLPLNTLQGIGFTLIYPPVLGDSAVVISPAGFDLDPCSLGENGQNLAARWQFYPAQGRIEMGITRLDHQNRDGVSLLGTLNCIVIVDIDHTGDTLNFAMNFDGTQIVTAAGQFVPVGAGGQLFGFTFFQDSIMLGGDEARMEPQLIEVFPNPHAAAFTARFLQSPFAAPVSLTLTDVLGRVVWKDELPAVPPGFEQRIETAELPAGLYFLQVRTPTERHIFEVVKK